MTSSSKYRLVNEKSNTSFDNTFGILAREVMDASMAITTGEELWTRIARLVMYKQSRAQQATTNLTHESYRIFQDEMVNVEMSKGSFNIQLPQHVRVCHLFTVGFEIGIGETRGICRAQHCSLRVGSQTLIINQHFTILLVRESITEQPLLHCPKFQMMTT